MALHCYGIMNDIHWPYECKEYDLILDLFSDQSNLKGILLNGDIGEFESLTTHVKLPTGKRFFSEERDYIVWRLGELREKFKGVPIRWVCGNHFHRFMRYLRDIAPELWGCL